MGTFELVKPSILSIQKIPNVSPEIAKEFNLLPSQNSLGIVTATSDHALFVSLDEGTKESDAEVIFTRSFYGGAKYSSGPLSGEVIGAFAGSDPDIIDDALKATMYYMEEKAFFYSANKNSSLIFFSHVIGSIGRFLSKQTGLPEGSSIAYLIAPPIESIIALDFAIKNSETKMAKMFKHPTETNFAGGYLYGTISNCEAAAEAFTQKILEIASNPIVRIG